MLLRKTQITKNNFSICADLPAGRQVRAFVAKKISRLKIPALKCL